MNAGLVAEVEGIMEMIDVSLGATAQYGESLKAFSQDLTAPEISRGRLREIVASVVTNTRDVAGNNRAFEARMR